MADDVRVYPILSPWGRFSLYSFFIDAPEPALIDTGIAVSPADGIVPALEQLGRRIEDLRWILLTHGHPDHIGGAYAAWEATGRRAQVAIHGQDARLLRARQAHVADYHRLRGEYLKDAQGPSKQEAMLANVISGEMDPTVELAGGEELSLGDGVSISVHHTPGHTPGSVSYVLNGLDWAFVGDAVQVHGAANRFPGYEDPAAYRASLRHLLETVRPQRLYLGHRFMNPAGNAYEIEVDGQSAASAVLEQSLDIESRIADVARRRLRADLDTNPSSAYAPFATIAAELDYSADPFAEPSPFFTTMNGYRQEIAAPADALGGAS